MPELMLVCSSLKQLFQEWRGKRIKLETFNGERGVVKEQSLKYVKVSISNLMKQDFRRI